MENEPTKIPDESEGIPSPLQLRKLPVKPVRVEIEVHELTSKNVPPFIESMAQTGLVGIFLMAFVLSLVLDGVPGMIASGSLGVLMASGAFAIAENSITKHHKLVSEHYRGQKALTPDILNIIRNIGKK